jgi:two-component system phosphate regulon sensor histidine kinase PhoR
MIEGIIVTDGEARIVSVNPAVTSLFNITAGDPAGMSFLEVIRNNDIADMIRGVLRDGKLRSGELEMAWPVQRALQINVSPIFSEGVIRGCLAVLHDITEIRRLETMRRDFVANVSHELKTPLTSIKGFVETLLDGALEDRENARHFLKIIEEHANRLDSLVRDLLALSYLESGEAALHKEDVEIRELVGRALAALEAQTKKRSIEVRNELPAGALVMADRDKLEQVLMNLVDNAVKFNRSGGTIRVYSEKTANGTKITVEDSGIGIPPKDISRIFERFYRVDKARSRELGGTGLGLSIVKHIVSLHGGEVGVESTEGLGSRFWFTLP